MATKGGPEHPINGPDWWRVHPAAGSQAQPGHVSVDEVTEWLNGTMVPGRDFLIIDVRRSDCESMIPTAVNFPAQSFKAALPSLLPLLESTHKIAFHCNSSKGRGTRCAGWLADAIAERLAKGSAPKDHISDIVHSQVLILTGGIVAWIDKHGEGSIENRGQPWDGKTLSTIQL